MLLLLSLCCQSAPALTPLRGNRHSGVVWVEAAVGHSTFAAIFTALSVSLHLRLLNRTGQSQASSFRGNKISHWYLHIILYFEQDVKNYFLKMVGPPRGYTANSDFGNQCVDTYTNDP